jgi:hypothetical protein
MFFYFYLFKIYFNRIAQCIHIDSRALLFYKHTVVNLWWTEILSWHLYQFIFKLHVFAKTAINVRLVLPISHLLPSRHTGSHRMSPWSPLGWRLFALTKSSTIWTLSENMKKRKFTIHVYTLWTCSMFIFFRKKTQLFCLLAKLSFEVKYENVKTLSWLWQRYYKLKTLHIFQLKITTKRKDVILLKTHFCISWYNM